MSKLLAFVFGFCIVVAHVPTWSQPSIEPKSALLLGAGALAWGWLGWKGRPMARYPWALLLPIGWLLTSAFWSPSPFFGLQRILWFLAAAGIGTLLAEEEAFDGFMKGFLAGSAIHAALIFFQWIPAVRVLMPISLGRDPFQGVGRGLFHNTNMAALPFVMLAGWLLLSKRGRSWAGHLVWLLPALALTQSRLGIGVCSGMLAFSAFQSFTSKELVARKWEVVPLVLLALAWSFTAHSWGWVLPAGGILLAAYRRGEVVAPISRGGGSQFLPVIGLVLAVLAGMPTRVYKNAPQTIVQGTVIQGDVSLSQRASYYRVAALAFLDRPFSGQGLGSARPLYPRFVDRNHPAAEIAYGDFQRPNNLHSELLEMLMEGGLPLLLFLFLGLWLDRNSRPRESRIILLVPVLLLALLDFPFHNPLGLLWVGITLAPLSWPMEDKTRHATRFLHGSAALWLIILAGFQIRVAMLRPGIENRFLATNQAALAQKEARSIWEYYSYSADIFDLYSKATIQSAATSPTPATIQELDWLLKRDPFDHHLLLCRAQVARRAGDQQTTQDLLNRYAAVAPRDPDRYLRLAKTALDQGKPEAAWGLIQESKKQPGFSPRQAEVVADLESRMH